ncbi:hypothetical protein FQN54_001388 [Arachnomyces sp. PD_36]|nr:hypothetical protein FQN54_001388 [Arachnomyces sp. PD_36]
MTSSNSQNPGRTSKWGVGSFFQQAVAGVESRLDTILAEEDAAPNKSTGTRGAQLEQQGQQSDLSRRSSNAQSTDRLQERLARAIVKQNTGGNAGGSALSTDHPSRTSSPLTAADDGRTSVDSSSGRMSTDSRRRSIARRVDNSSPASSLPRSSHDTKENAGDLGELDPANIPVPDGKDSLDDTRDSMPPAEGDGIVDSKPDGPDEAPLPTKVAPTQLTSPPTDYEAAMAQLQADHESAELRWQKELHGYVEKIDALQSKLKYLAKDAAESARKAASSAEKGSVEKELLGKDERIALLLEEGQKLSMTELEQRNTIKKLRQQASENNKSQMETKRRAERIERDLATAEAKAKRAETAEKKATERLNAQSRIERDLEAVTNERNAFSSTVADMKSQLARAVARAEAAEKKAEDQASQQESRQIAELKDDMASARVERDISEEKLRREISDLKEGIEREKEKARVLEVELRGEQSVLESKMETLRTRAEEVSSSATGDAQAKLLRQIETLQTQYAVASENWQGIEGSLVARLAAVEKERDEIARREGDQRRKAREVNLKAKKAESDLENSLATIQELESNLEVAKQEVQRLEQRLKKADDNLQAAQNDLAKQQEVSDLAWTQRLEEERAKWREQSLPPTPFLNQTRTASPVESYRKSPALGLGTHFSEVPRRSSTLPIQSPELETPPRQDSFPSLHAIPTPPHGSNGTPNLILEPPTIHAFEPDEIYSSSAARPTTPSAQAHTHSRGINDIISVSTVGAGPSVQLVERMSATVRRLESERAASKDELSRLTSQRDEAREEVVELMREVDEKRKSDSRIQELEREVEELDQRYQTTLEMLGEKSEQVEELKADIADLKKIYRELVDSTMK